MDTEAPVNLVDDDDDEFEDEEATSTAPGDKKADKKLKRFSVLGVRMKEYEAVFNARVDTKKPYIVRLDGHKFSTFTRPFKKPFDVRIHNAMRLTLADLVEHFRPTTGFTCSDEITLVFPIALDEKTGEHKAFADYDAKVQKITTLTSSYASVCFYKYLKEQKFEEEDKELLEHIEKNRPHFDSRIFNVPTNVEVVNNLLWRASWDFKRNSISTLAQAHFSPKQLHGKNTKQQLEMLKEKGILWENQPDWYKWGVFAKKEKFLKETDVKGEKIIALRTQIVIKSFEMDKKYTKQQEDWVVLKHWPASEDVLKWEKEKAEKGGADKGEKEKKGQ